MSNIDYISSAKERMSSRGASWVQAEDKFLIAEALATSLLTRLQASISETNSASLIVSGGSTPAPVFKALSGADIDWSRVLVTLADERWVPPGHADSNESLVRDTLMVDKAASAKFVSLYRPDISPDQALGSITADVKAMGSPFTAVVLGMGSDGHTASLFPDAPEHELVAAMDLNSTDTVMMMHPPSVPQARITLTRAALLNAKHRYLHITGEQKCQVLCDAVGNDPGARYQAGMAPVTGLLLESPESVSVYWSP